MLIIIIYLQTTYAMILKWIQEAGIEDADLECVIEASEKFSDKLQSICGLFIGGVFFPVKSLQDAWKARMLAADAPESSKDHPSENLVTVLILQNSHSHPAYMLYKWGRKN